MNYRTVLERFNSYRRKILQYQGEHFQLLKGEIEYDESYSGRRPKYLRERYKSNKIIVLGLLERKGKIYTTIVEDVKASSLLDAFKIKSENAEKFILISLRAISYFNFQETYPN